MRLSNYETTQHGTTNMKLRTIFFILIPLLLSACTFSLAEDVTPPPNYIAPTPMPTLGPLHPAEAPSLENGAAIYTEKCAACHGPQGMGDGAQGKQLPVTVAGLGLPQVARAVAPSAWFTAVTRGNLERFMPPFASLNDQERWDVVAYSLSLHTTPEQIAHGQTVFESNCADCSLDFFKNQTEMAALSADDLVLALKSGSDKVTALDGNLSDDDLYAAAAYLRTLTFAASLPTPEPATVTPTVAAAEATSSAAAGTPPALSTVEGSAESTPATTETAIPSTPEAKGGKITGLVSGDNVAGLTVTLRGFDHAADASGPQETVTLTTLTDANGNYTFTGLEMPETRIYIADAQYQGVTYNSELATVTAGVSEMVIPPFTMYETTADYSTLSFSQAHFFVDIADRTAQVIGVYTFSNTGGETIVVESTMGVPFLKMPADAQDVGFQLSQDSAPLLETQGGFAISPSETPYGIVAFYTLPYDNKVQIDQPFALPASSVLVLVPNGVKVKSDQLTEGASRSFQGADYDSFSGGPLKSGDTLTINLSGAPKAAGTTEPNSQQNLLIGMGALGLVLILAGVWMYLRDRNRPDEEMDEEEEADEFDNEEEILDAIIALDDLHRAGKLPDEAYQSRRAELKAKLK
ncbi:MAG TPA: c-type cytochrome [Anaerolineales bacterium]|nr:c-type cytochrome [Anaerolineales bacterium]